MEGNAHCVRLLRQLHGLVQHSGCQCNGNDDHIAAADTVIFQWMKSLSNNKCLCCVGAGFTSWIQIKRQGQLLAMLANTQDKASRSDPCTACLKLENNVSQLQCMTHRPTSLLTSCLSLHFFTSDMQGLQCKAIFNNNNKNRTWGSYLMLHCYGDDHHHCHHHQLHC